MVNYYLHQLNAVFSALGDPTRRSILERLAQGRSTVKELAQPFRVSLPAISKHLRILEQAGLLVRRKQGRLHHCHLNTIPLKTAAEWITFYQEFWERRFDSLEAFLDVSDQSSLPKECSPWPIPPQPTRPLSTLPGPSKPQGKKSSKRGPTPRH